jgi:hypothetical protein
LAGQRLDLGPLDWGEAGWSARAGPVLEPVDALVGVSATPQADGIEVKALSKGDTGVGVAVRGVQHDPDTDDLLVGGGAGVGQLLEPPTLGGGQDDLAGAGDGHAERFP